MQKQFDIPRRLAQVFVILALLLILGYFADSPPYQVLEDNQTELKLMVRHSGKLLGECEVLSAPDLEKVQPNMRQPLVCPREKSPLFVELKINDTLAYERTVYPSGIHNDGVLALYQRFPLPVGRSSIELKVKEKADSEEFSHELSQTFDLSTESILVVEFTDSGLHSYQPGRDT